MPTAFTVLQHLPNTSVLFGDFSVDKRCQSDTVLEGYEPFLSDGYISLLGQNVHSNPFRILRDTGASQSLLLADTMSFSEESSSGESVLIQGV